MVQSDSEQVREILAKLDKQYAKELICQVCESLPYEPVSCPECEEIFCHLCVSEKIKDTNKCPKCNKQVKQENLEKLHKKLLSILNGQQVEKCPQCQETGYKYDSFIFHLFNDCAFFKIFCPFNCGEKFFRKDSLEHACFYNAHNCQELNNFQHNNNKYLGCLQILTQKIHLQEQKVKKLEDQNRQKDEKMQKMKERRTYVVNVQVDYLTGCQDQLKELLYQQIEYKDNFQWRCLSQVEGLAPTLRCSLIKCQSLDSVINKCETCTKPVCNECIQRISKDYKKAEVSFCPNKQNAHCNFSSAKNTDIKSQLDNLPITNCPFCYKKFNNYVPALREHFMNECQLALFPCLCGQLVNKQNLLQHIITCQVNDYELLRKQFDYFRQFLYFKDFLLFQNIVLQYKMNHQFLQLIKMIDDDNEQKQPQQDLRYQEENKFDQ